jgi:hypothetical protein
MFHVEQQAVGKEWLHDSIDDIARRFDARFKPLGLLPG